MGTDFLLQGGFMQLFIKQFNELSLDELYDILAARADVFIMEQNCVCFDPDGADKEAYHVYFKEDGKIVAYLRVIDKGKRLDEVSIGRVICLKRRQGIGSALMKEGLRVAKEKFGADKVKIGAQLYAKPFYEGVGFKQVSEQYLEDDIPHIYMIVEV